MSDVEDKGTAIVKSGQEAKPVAQGRGGKVVGIRRGDTTPDLRAPGQVGQLAWPATAQYAVALVERRRSRARRLFAWFALIVMLPTLITAVYTTVLATPLYTSEFEFTYQTFKGPSSLAAGLVQSVTGTAQNNTVDIGTIVYEYLRSATLAEKLDASLGLRAHYASPKIDWLFRLSATASREAFLNYFHAHVDVSQGLGGYLKVEVDDVDPVFAQSLAKAVVAAADTMVDDLTARARRDEVNFAEAELGRQEDRVRKARLALTSFQNRQGDQDPSRAASQLGNIVGSIEGQLADARGQLSTATGSLSPNSPIAVQLKAKVASLEGQLKAEQNRLATDKTDGGKPYSQVLEDYAGLQLEQDFAKNAYMAAQQGLVVARADAATKQNYLVDFVPPGLPQRQSYAYPAEATATVLLSSLLLFAFGSLILGAARDQIMG